MDQNIRTTLKPGGILVATIDMPGRPMNVFSESLMDSVDALIDRVAADPEIRGVVITGGKQTFLVGADLEMVLGFTRAAATAGKPELHALCGRLGRLFRRLEASPKPYVAAINGLALGGGLELCLACHVRLVSDAKGLQLGLPEAKLGLLPGAGGTQRLPRLVGLATALPMLLRGTTVNAADAVATGLAEAIVPANALVAAAIDRARTLQAPKAPWDRPGFVTDKAGIDLGAADSRAQLIARAGVTADELRWNPAIGAILNCLILGLDQDIVTAAEREMDCFVDLIRDPGCGNMVRTLFIDRRRAERQLNAVADVKVGQVAVVGTAPEAFLQALKSRAVEIVEAGPADAVVVAAGGEAAANSDVALLTGPKDKPSARGCAVGVFFCPATANGRAIEIVIEHDAHEAETKALALVRKLQGVPLITRGGRSVLAALMDARSGDEAAARDAVIAAAARTVAEGLVRDAGLLDVAAVIAGIIPAALGGPITAGRIAVP
jgi:3-hydroxyacyl-CoA dehydrogenase/enoyl-CoA hydratase/3-hydroxybutyryl-CoA epimerase